MENKNVGTLIIAIGIIVGAIVLIFNYTNKQLVNATCSHGLECTMYDTLALQMWMSLSIVAIILVIGFAIMFIKPKEKIIIKKIKEKKKKLNGNVKGYALCQNSACHRYERRHGKETTRSSA
ncbi:MAG: hypothetical protein ABFQ65_01390 [Nanoarchaeota archaeon]